MKFQDFAKNPQHFEDIFTTFGVPARVHQIEKNQNHKKLVKTHENNHITPYGRFLGLW